MKCDKFASYEISLVGRFCETCDPDDAYVARITDKDEVDDDMLMAEFWTLYGRLPSGEVVAVFNNHAFQACFAIYAHITGRTPNIPTPGPESCYCVELSA
ncbi:hypothetical protein UFOVP142_63 [uncultured Caudovirales phage]|uniref:Uncharacterized protein n=1 Tax=uncultured Caudovirales phage TaxID=2100421 RepID=A0A6J7XL57_9CAUD|nr:hypothetical protein UFOVP142_63 [uncultured Caudovirales phage]